MQSTQPLFRRSVARLLLAAFAATLPGSPALADLAGEQVVSGDVSIERAGDVTTIHASDGAIIEYDRFSVWSNEELHFVQPDSQSRVMNRVLGDDPTHIDGGLFANGIVYIVNPVGIFFGAGAVVDVGGLYAAAGDVSNEDFLAGVDRFELSGPVENAGRITSPEVALLGRVVANHGEIHAPDGTIALVAGERVLLTSLAGHLHVEVEGAAGGPDVAAIEQSGTLDAGPQGEVSFTTGDVYSLALNHDGITRGGRIEARAARGLLQVAGLLDASDLSEGGTGGEIALTGEQVALLGAVLDASGDAGGGALRVGGDLRGAGALPNAKRTFVDADSVLRADAVTRGDGGTVVVYADEATAFHGAISARGGDEGGDGGFAEISGAVFLFSGGDVDLRAVQGETGTLLYDPQDVVLRGGVMDGDDDVDASDSQLVHDPNDPGTLLFADADALAAPFEIYESEIERTNADIVIEATHSIAADDASLFTNDEGGEGTGVLRIADGQSLTLRTRNDPGDETDGAATRGIDLGSLALQTTGGGGVLLETGVGGVDGNLGGDIRVGDITTSGADGVLGGDAGSVTLAARGPGALDVGAIEARGGAGSADAGGAGGAVTLSTTDGGVSVASIDTSGGDSDSASLDPLHAGGAAGAISIAAGDGDASGDSDARVLGSLVAVGGTAAEGAGGAGGGVDVTSTGVATPIAVAPVVPSVDPIAGGGDLSLVLVDTRGGAGGASGSGGAGGAVVLDTSDGAIAANTIRTEGGAGGAGGGAGGFVRANTRDADQSGDASGDNGIAIATLSTFGGAGGTGTGGSGGAITLRTQRSLQVRDTADPDADPLQEALGGGDVDVATIDTHGGMGDAGGGRGGSVNLTANGDGMAIAVSGAVTSVGGQAGTEEDARGGFGGGVTITTDDGTISVTTIDTSGGSTDSVDPDMDEFGGSGGSAGAIAVVSVDSDGSRDGHVTVTGDLVALGGSAAEGSGGRGGSVTVGVDGERTPLPVPPPPDDVDFDPSSDPFLGGGDIDLQNIFAGGGSGGVGGNGGGGGAVQVGSGIGDQVISVGDIDTSGGDGGVAGGSGGDVSLFSLDADGNNDDDITTGVLTTRGGAGTNDDGSGGGGGNIDVRTFPRAEVTQTGDPDTILQESTGGGAVSIERIDTRGGDGAFGGNGGRVVLGARGAGNGVEIRDKGAGIVSIGGSFTGDPAGLGAGGSGGVVQIGNEEETLVVDFAIDASGGDASTATGGVGGISGVVLLQTGLDDDDPAADLVVTTRPINRGGASADGTRAFSRTLILNSSGRTELDVGDVALYGDLDISADGGFDLRGTLDADPDGNDLVAFTATVGGASTLEGDIGATGPLAVVSIAASEDAVDPTLRFEGTSVATTGLQRFDPAVTVVGDTSFDAGGSVSIGPLDADPAAGSSNVAFTAAEFVQFTGDVGAAQPISALDVDASEIAFNGTDAQSVNVGAGGIRLGSDLSSAPIAPVATIARLRDDLRLETTGDLLIGDRHKLSVPGTLALIGDRVRVTDLSALDLTVQANTLEIFARQEGAVLLPNGAQTVDLGTDLIANTVSFSTAPSVFGAGATPRVATFSGAATNAGPLPVSRLARPIVSSDIAATLAIFDLAIPVSDPGLETPELPVDPVEVPAGLYPSQDEAAPDATTSSAEVVAHLACAPVRGDAPPGCAPTAKPRDGSALDTERADEAAVAWRWLIGSSKRAEAGRSALARTGGEPDAPLADTSPAGRVYLARAARLLAELRMLGLGAERYGEVRGELLAELVDAIGAPEVDGERLLTGIEAYAMGMTL